MPVCVSWRNRRDHAGDEYVYHGTVCVSDRDPGAVADHFDQVDGDDCVDDHDNPGIGTGASATAFTTLRR